MFDAQALLAGDENALADAVDTLSPELYRYAAGIVLTRMDAEDAVQTAFVALWRHRTAVMNPEAVRAYLYRCTYRACVDLIRKNKLFAAPAGREESPLSAPLSEEMTAALSRLSPVERAIVYERAVTETPYDELAAHLGIRADAARKKYERAKKKLARLLPGMRTEENDEE